MIRIGKTLLVIGCLSLASAACASDDAAARTDRMKDFLAQQANLHHKVIEDIKRRAPNYELNEMPDKSAVVYTVRMQFPARFLRTISVVDKPVTKTATVLDVDADLNPSSTSFEGAQAQSILEAMKQYGKELKK